MALAASRSGFDRKPGLVPDQFRHELATAFNLKGRGLIVLTSCSHRGLINAIKQAQAVSGADKAHAVIGGFHLGPYQPDYLRQTIAALREIDPTYVVPLHCSGEPSVDLARAELPIKLLCRTRGRVWSLKVAVLKVGSQGLW